MKVTRRFVISPLLIIIGLLFMGFSKLNVLYSPVTIISKAPQGGGLFGVAVAGMGDLNNDGIGEIVVGASSEQAAGVSGAGRVYVLSGFTLDTLFTLHSPFPEAGGNFGSSVANAGDVNNDGKNDIIVGAQGEDAFDVRDAGRAYIFDGSNGDTLFTLNTSFPDVFGNFSAAVAAAGDVNNDGFDDVIVGAERENVSINNNAGIVYVFSGQTGDTLFTLTSLQPETGGLFGISVSGIGDIDKDNHADLVVGSLENIQYENDGRVYIFSGNTGDTIHVIETPFPKLDGAFGREVAAVGDLNGDDTSDVAIAAPGEVYRVYIYSGSTGDTLFTLKSPSEQNIGFGSVISAAGDVNDDGTNDIVVGAPSENWGGMNNAGRAYIYSGATGELILTMQSLNPEVDAFFGNAVSGAGNISVDDSSDVIIGAHGEDVSGLQSAGRAYLFASGDPISHISQSEKIPAKFSLEQNFPNPFNPVTTISFVLFKNMDISIDIYSIDGRHIKNLQNGRMESGGHKIKFNASEYSTGLYLYRLKAGDYSIVKKMMLIK